MFTFASQSALVAVIIGLVTAIAALLRDRRALNLRFAVFAFSATLFFVVSFLRSLIGGVDFDPLHLVSAALVLVSATIFFQSLLSVHGIRAVRRGRLSWLAAAVLIVLALTPIHTLLWARVLASVVALSLLASLVWTMETRARSVASEVDRWRLRYVALGGLAVIAAAALDLIAGQGLRVPPAGGIATAIYLYVLLQILDRRRLLDLHELLAKAAVFSALALILAAVYGLLVRWSGDAGLFVFNTLLASAIILVLYDPLRSRLDELFAKTFFGTQRAFSRTLAELSRSLLSLVDSDEVQRRILDTIYNSRRATQVALYLRDAQGVGLELSAHRGPRPATRLEPALERRLLDHLHQHRDPLQRDELLAQAQPRVPLPEESVANDTFPLLGNALDAMAADLDIPIVVHDQVLGLLTLRDDRVSAAFTTHDEMRQLLRIADQVAVALDNSRAIADLRDRDRLALLGEMAAGLAHEIRNPLGSIKSTVQYLQPTLQHAEQREFFDIVLSEVDRLDRVVAQFLTYARPNSSTFAPFDLNEVIRRSLQLMRTGDIPDDVEVELQLQDDLPPLSGDIDQLRQVILNLVLNAVQAMGGKGQLRICTRGSPDAPASPNLRVVLTVADDGPGIDPELRRRLFAPFFSTRAGGTGLGLAICKRIIEAHGGQISVCSSTGQGAKFSVQIPLHPGPAMESTPTLSTTHGREVKTTSGAKAGPSDPRVEF